jgi:hypothetical protein
MCEEQCVSKEVGYDKRFVCIWEQCVDGKVCGGVTAQIRTDIVVFGVAEFQRLGEHLDDVVAVENVGDVREIATLEQQVKDRDHRQAVEQAFGKRVAYHLVHLHERRLPPLQRKRHACAIGRVVTTISVAMRRFVDDAAIATASAARLPAGVC